MQGNQAFADTPRARHAWSCSDLSGSEPHKWHRVTLFALGCRQIITAVRLLCDEGQLQRCSYLLPVSYWWMDRGCLACGASVQSSLRQLCQVCCKFLCVDLCFPQVDPFIHETWQGVWYILLFQLLNHRRWFERFNMFQLILIILKRFKSPLPIQRLYLASCLFLGVGWTVHILDICQNMIIDS